MNKENCVLKLVDEIILYYDARSKKHKKNIVTFVYISLSRGKSVGAREGSYNTAFIS